MRSYLVVLILAALAAGVWAQDPAKKAEENPPAGGEKAEKPEEAKKPVAWKMDKKSAKKIGSIFEDYLQPKKKNRSDILAKFEKQIAKKIDGHSALEDVASFVDMANRNRVFNAKLRKGKITEVAVAPKVHGFPGGVGTVKYWLWVPNNYNARKALSPLLFCMPDNKKYGDGRKYIEEIWVKRSPKIADNYLVAVPQPQAKGEAWTAPKSMARAMITLRHLCAPWGADKKTGGPATDLLRIFINGEDAAAAVAARFAEMFCGAILSHSDGRTAVRPDLLKAGQLNGLASYTIHDGKSKRQKLFAEKIKAANALSKVEDGSKIGNLGNAKQIAAWMESLPPRDTQPAEIEYAVHDSSFQRHYWITVLDFDGAVKPAPTFLALADRPNNEIAIDVTGISRFELFLNDALIDLSKPIKIVVVDGETELPFFKTENGMDTATRDLSVMLDELIGSNHPWRIYPVKYVVDVAELRARAAAREAEKKAADEAKKAGGAEKPAKTEQAQGKPEKK